MWKGRANEGMDVECEVDWQVERTSGRETCKKKKKKEKVIKTEKE